MSRLKSTLDVSRETMTRLELLSHLLEKWNPRINLVSKSTISELWTRHILDSVQVYQSVPDNTSGSWLDIGSGGGFPGLVVAILNAERRVPFQVTMMESDVRKCSFLRTVLRETDVSGAVITSRIEQADPFGASVLSARALADLSLLFEFAERHLAPDGICLFPKGVRWKKEIESAEESWSFQTEVINSVTQEGAVILKVGELARV